MHSLVVSHSVFSALSLLLIQYSLAVKTFYEVHLDLLSEYTHKAEIDVKDG